MASSEETIFARDAIRITTTRVVIRNKTYAMSNITSVSMQRRKSRNCLASSLLMIGLLALLSGLVSIADGTYPWTWFILSAFLIGAAIFLYRPVYELRLASASGEISALQSTKEDVIQEIAGAINEAIIRRG